MDRTHTNASRVPSRSGRLRWLGWLLALAAPLAQAQAPRVEYIHTDALGSPVAITNAAAEVIERTDWQPYGAAIDRPAYEGVGYTGHVMDGATGLVYMQQRYYDPTLGRFVSVDPVGVSPINGLNFNRYWYASNHPYKNTDPDGRCDGPSTCAIDRDIAAMNRGDMSRSEFMDRSAARAGGAAGGLLIVATRAAVLRYLPALSRLVSRNREQQPKGDLHAPGDVPDASVVVRGGAGEMPAPGTTFSGSQGRAVEDAGAGVPHGTIRTSTAGEIRSGGGRVDVAPEPTRSGQINGQHVNVTEGGTKSTFSPPQPNPVPKPERIQ